MRDMRCYLNSLLFGVVSLALLSSCSEERKREAAKLEEQVLQQDSPKPETLKTPTSAVALESIKVAAESSFIASQRLEKRAVESTLRVPDKVETAAGSLPKQAERSAARSNTKDSVVFPTPVAKGSSEGPKSGTMPPHPAGDSYTVQIASTVSRSEADAQAAFLMTRGYEAYVSVVTMDSRNRYRVRIGKFPTRKEAVVLTAELHNKFSIDGWVDKISE